MTFFHPRHWATRWFPENYYADGSDSPSTEVTGDGTAESWTLTAKSPSGVAEVTALPGSWTLTSATAEGANTSLGQRRRGGVVDTHRCHRRRREDRCRPSRRRRGGVVDTHRLDRDR